MGLYKYTKMILKFSVGLSDTRISVTIYYIIVTKSNIWHKANMYSEIMQYVSMRILLIYGSGFKVLAIFLQENPRSNIVNRMPIAQTTTMTTLTISAISWEYSPPYSSSSVNKRNSRKLCGDGRRWTPSLTATIII